MEMSLQHINNLQAPSYFECSQKNFTYIACLKNYDIIPEIFVKKFTYIMETRQNASIKFDTNYNDVIIFKYQ